MARRFITLDLVVGLSGILALVALAMALFVWPAGAQEAAPGPACHTSDEIGAFYAPDDAVAYSFAGSDASAVVNVLVGMFGPPPGGPPVTVYVGIDLYDDTTDFFLYDANGCFAGHLGPMPMDATLQIMAQAKVQPPFGATFHGGQPAINT